MNMAFLDRKIHVSISSSIKFQPCLTSTSTFALQMQDTPSVLRTDDLRRYAFIALTPTLLPYMLRDEPYNASGGQTAYSEPHIHQSEAYKPRGCWGEEVLVEKASTDSSSSPLMDNTLLARVPY